MFSPHKTHGNHRFHMGVFYVSYVTYLVQQIKSGLTKTTLNRQFATQCRWIKEFTMCLSMWTMCLMWCKKPRFHFTT